MKPLFFLFTQIDISFFNKLSRQYIEYIELYE